MTRQHVSIAIIISILIAFTVFPIASARPANFRTAAITVTSKLDTPDPGKCRLRDAIIAANTNTATGDCPAGAAGLDTIHFNVGFLCTITPCIITLTAALPTVTEDLTFDGNNSIISGANAFRIFDLDAVVVTMSNLSIRDGSIADSGGAINLSDAAGAGATLTLSNVSFSNNHANFGGAIYQPRGTLTIVDSNFSGNTATLSGGAIMEERNGSLLVIDQTRFTNNTAVNSGGALDLVSDAFISHSTFSGNSATYGGAIAKVVLGGLHLDHSVLDNNAATGQADAIGGAIYFSTGPAALTNVTLSGNSARKDGGGIHISLGTVTLNNVTLTGNTADSDNDGVGDGGGIFRLDATVQVQNSIIAGNFDTPGSIGTGTIAPDCSGAFSSFGYNLLGRNDHCSGFTHGVNGDQVGSAANPIDPLLGALANNGGPTRIHALLLGSPAINAGNPLLPGSGGFACAAADQRGVARPQSSACDTGAFEFEYRSLYLPLILR